MLNNFAVIVPVYNAEKWIGQCIESIITQDYPYYKIYVIDDHSTDQTWDIIKSYNVYCKRNSKRIGALANLIQGIKQFNKNDIIVTVDGDDYLADDCVLSYLNEVYQKDIYLTYGSFLPISGRYSGTCQLLSHTHTVDESGKWVDNYLTPQTYRKSGVWVTSHLRTFKKWLWDKVEDEDLKDKNDYYKVAWDMAFMYPMIEMAGNNILFIEKILYIYNDLNPNCDGTVDPELQIRTGKSIQAKSIYKEL
jgi:glycosyltransferase involved in cell wall biosynthesis